MSKLGKELTAKVVDIPPIYVDTFKEVLSEVRGRKFKAFVSADKDELLALQKAVQACDEIEKVFADAHKEKQIYSK